jgi:hypothetical protein
MCGFETYLISQNISSSTSAIRLVYRLAGIVFFRTVMLEEIVDFYVNEIGMHLWLEQEDCTILSHGNLLLGFCHRDMVEIDGTITFFYPTEDDVDTMYKLLGQIATSEPVLNDRYQIYQFFAEDPEGRSLEFQAFLHPVEPIGF